MSGTRPTALSGPLPACGFLVQATKAGSLPLSIEKRAKGKKVTVVDNVRGNADALLSALSRVLGVGGSVNSKGALSEVEIQGEQIERASKVLQQLGCVRGLSKANAALAAPVLTVERNEATSAFDGVLDEGRRRSDDRKPRHNKAAAAALREEPPEDAPCRRWHGYWIYCRGVCEEPKPTGNKKDDILFGNLWSDSAVVERYPKASKGVAWKKPSPSAAAATAAAAAAKPLDELDRGLRSLCMLAEVGVAVRDFVWQQDTQKAATAQRRVAPVVSRRAADAVGVEGSFKCSKCGAVFAAQKTLRAHLAQHRRDEEGVSTGVAAANPDAQWRKTSLALEGLEWGWEDRPWARGQQQFLWSDDEGDDPPQVTAASTAAQHSLADFVVKAPQKQKKNNSGSNNNNNKGNNSKGTGKASGGKGEAAADCPVCGASLPVSQMDVHLDVCLTSVGQASEGHQAAVASSSIDADGSSPGALPQYLLETFLDLDLAPRAAQLFWERYEALVTASSRGSSPEDAFMAALEEAMALEESDDEIVITASKPVHGRSIPTTVQAVAERVPEVGPSGTGGTRRQPKAPPPPQPLIHSGQGEEWQEKGGRFRAGKGKGDVPAALAGKGSGSQSSTKGSKNGKGAKAAPPPPPPDKQKQQQKQLATLGTSSTTQSQRRSPTTSGISYAEASDVLIQQSKAISSWLQEALSSILGLPIGDAEGVASGVEVVLSNAREDSEAFASARELLVSELDQLEQQDPSIVESVLIHYDSLTKQLQDSRANRERPIIIRAQPT